jgi:hypothetical protein
MLYARGSSIPVAMYGLGAEYAGKEGAVSEPSDSRSRQTPESIGDQASRKVELRVHLAQLPSDTGLLNIFH